MPADPIFISEPELVAGVSHFHQALLNQLTTFRDGFPLVNGGLPAAHDLLDKIYPLSAAGPAVEAIKNSASYKKGFKEVYTTDSRREISKKWINIIDSIFSENDFTTNLQVNGHIKKTPELFNQLRSDWFVECANIMAQLNMPNSFIIWHWAIDRISASKGNVEMGYSGQWHCDGAYPATCPKLIFYLNDAAEHLGGTDILDVETSNHISQQTGYIGLVQKRVSQLDQIGFNEKKLNIKQFRPKGGDAILFWPNRVLHRGIIPRQNARYTITLSLIPAYPNNDVDIAQNPISDRALENMITGNDILPFFVPATPQPASNEAYLWDGTVSEQWKQKFILSSLATRFTQYSEEDRQTLAAQLAVFSNLSQFLAYTTIEQFFNEMNGFLQFIKYDKLQSVLMNYVESINTDAKRYNDPELRDRIFWPNPIHPNHPKPLKNLKPYARRFPILTKQTPIATAGSCFAFEISAVLQEQGYNYIIAERADTARDGIIIDGEKPDDKYVKFSANYGILFNTPSLFRLAQRAFGTAEHKKLLVPENNYFVDPYRESVFFLSPDAYAKDYEKHTAAIRHVLTNCEVFVFTLGLNECWVFRDDGTAISRNPRPAIYPLVTHKRLTVAENVRYVADFYRLCLQHNPNMKLILTVSPVPFLATGLAETSHVVEANCHSKSVLRVAAQELTDTFEHIYYFPSYEMATHTLDNVWEPDLRHVTREAVTQIVEVFYEMFSA